jgi:hypothetical protein
MKALESSMALCELSEFRDLSDLTLLAAAYAAKAEFETAIGWQEKIIETAVEPQKSAAKKILELYQQKKPLDPKLLEITEEEQPPAPPASAKDDAEAPAENAPTADAKETKADDRPASANN